MYKHWDEWVTEIPHPFVADFKTGSGYEVANETDIMKGEPFECPMKPFGGAETFAWSPDSKKLVYTSRKLKGKEYAFSTDSNLYLYDLASGKTECLTEGIEGYDTNPVFARRQPACMAVYGDSKIRERQETPDGDEYVQS